MVKVPRRYRTLHTCLVLALACGDDNGLTGPNGESLRLVAGNGGTDTITAAPIQALVVEVLGPDGQPATGTLVRFLALPVSASNPYTPSMLVGDLASQFFGTFVTEAIDARGRASVLVRFGAIAGTGRIAIEVPEFGMADTALFVVLPGAAVGVAAFPKDTVLYAGASFQSAGAAIDRFRNPRPDPVSFAPGAGGITVTATGRISATSISRAHYRVLAGGHTDTGWVSVAPQGTIAALYSGDSAGIVTVNLDGSGFRWLTRAALTYDAGPAWSPAGTRLVYAQATPNTAGSALYSVDLSGNAAPLLQAPPTSLGGATWPIYAKSGAYVYFSGLASGEGNFSLWRASNTGTGAQQIGPPAGCCNILWRSAPSANGAGLAFVTDGGGAVIRVLDLVADTVLGWSVPGQSPRWDPTGNRIAYVDQFGGLLRVVNGDGTGAYVVSPAGKYYAETAPDWSPDGQWLVTRCGTTGLLELINVVSGLSIPLGYSAQLFAPNWKP